ncbi:uncharacterized protein ARMOST_20300 [Armillaria ostoyae]|uniref:Uncharacterized protein n=1 Tax=Armillaria ostoyae TaxID=47428 RepID=A0A284S6Z1_ARMOS|nr:uncharacterized protein ARMOST_20300 [Armillaria ostoyae]
MRPGTIALPLPTNFPSPNSSSSSAATTRSSTPSPPHDPNPTSPNPSQDQNDPEPRPPHPDLSHLLIKMQQTPLISTAPTSNGTSSTPSTSSYSDHIALWHGRSEGATWRPATSFDQTTGPPCAGTSPWNEATPSNESAEMPPSQPRYSTTGIATTTALPQGMYSEEWPDREQPENSLTWSSPYLNWPLDSERRTPPSIEEFDHFHYDQGTFGDYIPELLEDYQGYTLAPYRPPDSPPHPRITHPQCIQGYHAPQYGMYPMGGANDAPDQGGSNDIPIDPPLPQPPVDVQPTPAERLQEAKDLADRKAERIAQMCQAIKDEERAHDEHVRYWNLPNQNQGKGKKPDRGRCGAPPPPPDPNWQRRLSDRDD